MDTALDPLAPAPHGLWSGPGVRVRRRSGPHRAHQSDAVCTPRFCTHRSAELLTVEHNLTPDELSDELAVQLAEQLVDTGALRGQPEFESVFTGIVRSTVDGGWPAWRQFYVNSMARLEDGSTAFAPIHHRAAALVAGPSVVDLGSCFGFFPLRLSRMGIAVTATDLSAPTMQLLELASMDLRRPLHTVTADAADVPLPDGYADTVTALHLIEHLPDAVLGRVLSEALRLARRRVVVAVPFEDEPRECYGHIQRFDPSRLQALGEQLCDEHAGLTATVDEFHGGWLILDLP
ncbi:MAG: mycofactocin oligosaccharide methyltransferase MftM [Mycobacterium sp.]